MLRFYLEVHQAAFLDDDLPKMPVQDPVEMPFEDQEFRSGNEVRAWTRHIEDSLPAIEKQLATLESPSRLHHPDM